ncbi:hypothetical protein DMP03_06960 [Halosegnis rubeus]|uniref:Uncharacterized protein n=2 Tax=Halosegnis rubeus TaxID=2212850 RepID=A0A5N5UI59_9EURY|nr:hypothetical protein DMP03_06960 [Halosegnis rubeus]
MQNGGNAVIEAPTSSGKTYTVSTTNWRDHPEIAGEQPVIMLSGSKKARDSAFEQGKSSSAATKRLRGREDTCPLAWGEYDEGENKVIAPEGMAPSAWFDEMCNTRGHTFSFAHGVFERAYDGDLPCSEDGKCASAEQWDAISQKDGEAHDYDVLHATHMFARVPQLIVDSNVVIDESPDYSVNLPKGRLRESVTSYLGEIDADVSRWADTVTLLRQGALPEGFAESLEDPGREWFRDDSNAHALTPGITRAIATAEERCHNLWVGESEYSYPELIPNRDTPDNNITIRIVFDENNEVRLLQAIPDFEKARSIIGLDAFPTMPLWEGNVLKSLTSKQVVGDEAKHQWRRNTRELRIVQIGDNKNTWTRNGFNEAKVRALVEELRWQHGDDFQTGITSKRFEPQLQEILTDADITTPQTLHLGNEKSLNDFDSEGVGLVAGCISPSSDHIKTWLALLDGDAAPKRECFSDYQGQEWLGPGSSVAMELLNDVQLNHVLQSCGRYARSPEKDDSGATVYVLSNVLPAEWTDKSVDDVTVLGKKQRDILEYLRLNEKVAPSSIEQQLDVTRKYVHDTLNKYTDYPWFKMEETEGHNEPNLYSTERCPSGILDISDTQGVN